MCACPYPCCVCAYVRQGGVGRQHSEVCVNANVNILSLYGNVIPYNTCRNFEWQLCAAKGMLPGQGARVQFAYAPRYLKPFFGERPLGSCAGYMPMGCGRNGYASSDIFYLEVCVFDQICSNRDEMWALDVGDDWTCDMDLGGFQQLRRWVLGAKL